MALSQWDRDLQATCLRHANRSPPPLALCQWVDDLQATQRIQLHEEPALAGFSILRTCLNADTYNSTYGRTLLKLSHPIEALTYFVTFVLFVVHSSFRASRSDLPIKLTINRWGRFGTA